MIRYYEMQHHSYEYAARPDKSEPQRLPTIVPYQNSFQTTRNNDPA